MYCLVRTWLLAAEPLAKVIDPPRSFEPLSNEMVAGVYVDLPQPPGAGVDELVRHSGRHHHEPLPGGASTTMTETLAPRRRPWNSPVSSLRAGSAMSSTRVTPHPLPTAP